MSEFETAVSHSRARAKCEVTKSTNAVGGSTGGGGAKPADSKSSNVGTGLAGTGISDTRKFATGPAHKAPASGSGKGTGMKGGADGK